MIYISYFTDEKKKCPIFLTYHELIVLKIFYLLLLLFPKFCLQIVTFFNGFVTVNNSVIYIGNVIC